MRSLPGSGTVTGRVAGFLIGHLDFRQWPRPPTWSTGNKSPSAPIDQAMMTNGCRTAPILPAGRGTGPTPPTQIEYQSRSALAPRRRPGRPATRHRPRGCARRPSTAHTHIREWSSNPVNALARVPSASGKPHRARPHRRSSWLVTFCPRAPPLPTVGSIRRVAVKGDRDERRNVGGFDIVCEPRSAARLSRCCSGSRKDLRHAGRGQAPG